MVRVHHFNRSGKDIPIKVGDKEYVTPNKTMIFYNSEYVRKYSKLRKVGNLIRLMD